MKATPPPVYWKVFCHCSSLCSFCLDFFKFFRLAEAVCDIRDIAMQMTVTHKEGTKK